MPTCDRKPCRDIRGGGHARPAVCRDPTSRILAFSRGSNLEGRWRPSNLRLRSIYLGLLTASAGQPPERYFHGWFHLRRSQSSPAPHEDDRQPDCPTVSSCSLCRNRNHRNRLFATCKIHTDSCIQKGYFRRCWNSQPPSDSVRDMRSSDIICPQCNAGYRRIEVASSRRTKGEYRCLLCDHVLEVFDGSTEVGIRLTVQPEKTAK